MSSTALEMPFVTMRSAIETELNRIINSVGSGSNVIFMTPNILAALSRLNITTRLQKDYDNVVGVLALDEKVEYVQANNILYFLNPDVELLRPLATHMISYSQRFPTSRPYVYFVPLKTIIVEHVLLEEFKLSEMCPQVIIGCCDISAFPADEDVILMEQPLTFKHLHLYGDITPIKYIARTLLKLQVAHFGVIPFMKAKGNISVQVLRQLEAMQMGVGGEFLTELPSCVDGLVMFDRAVDLVTPLLTQLTYEGLIDDLYGIVGNDVVFPFRLGDTSKVAPGQKVALTVEDKVFAAIRNKNFCNVGAALHERSVFVKQQYERRKGVQQIKELKEFMKGLPEIQELHRLVGLHTVVATEVGKTTQSRDFRRRVETEQKIIQQVNDRDVIEYIEELILKQEPFLSVLRIVCLYSVVNDGISGVHYSSLKETMMIAYGIPQVLCAWIELEKCNLLRRNEGGSSSYATVRKHYRAWNASLTEQQPNDIAYAFSGYAPPLVRALEFFSRLASSNRSVEGVLDNLSGASHEIRVNCAPPGGVPTTIFCVLGGITKAEVSTIRYLQDKLEKDGIPRKFVVLSTDCTNGKRLIGSLLPFQREEL